MTRASSAWLTGATEHIHARQGQALLAEALQREGGPPILCCARSLLALFPNCGGELTYWAALGAILGRRAKIIKKSMPNMTDFGSQKGAQREPKSNPKPTKIEDKKSTRKKHLFKIVLERSWVILGRLLGSFLLIFYCCLKLFVKKHFLQKISL